MRDNKGQETDDVRKRDRERNGENERKKRLKVEEINFFSNKLFLAETEIRYSHRDRLECRCLQKYFLI